MILGTRIYLVQELLTAFLFFSFAFVLVLLLAVILLLYVHLIDRALDFLEPRLRELRTCVRIMTSEAFHRLAIIAESLQNPVSMVPFVIKEQGTRNRRSRSRENRGNHFAPDEE